VTDDHINDAFSAIDREGAGNTLPSAPATDSAPRYQPSAPAPWSQSTDPTASALPPAQPANRTAGSPVGTPDWPAIPTDAPNSTNVSPNPNPAPATPAAIPPAPEPDPMSASASPITTTASHAPAAAAPASPSGAVPGQPSAAASKNGWDPELDPPTPEWQNAMHLNSPEAAPTAAPAGTAAPNTAVPPWQPDGSPRIVATNVTPNGSASPAPPPRTADALDQFEAELQKNNPGVAAGKSFSNSAAVAKPAVQPLPRDQAAANKPTQPTDSSAAGVQPWSVRIQPRRDPPPLFGPDDASPTQKKQPADKQNGFETGTNWSDVPAWQGAPSSGAAAGTSSSTDGGPTIRPGQ
jgi:DNA polymerase III subunit gamma/tau